jgi:hypothetical protein
MAIIEAINPTGQACEDLELFLQLLREELFEDFEINERTNRLTEKQKALLPLYSQMLSACSGYTLQDEFYCYVGQLTTK